VDPPDLSERGRGTSLDRRLYMQLLVFDHCDDPQWLVSAIQRSGGSGVVYAEISNPRGCAMLTVSEDPSFFVGPLREALGQGETSRLPLRAGWSMLGRTYTLGYETDLHHTLFARPIDHAFSDDMPWAVWYPLRRKGEFAKLPSDEQRKILGEHGQIGMSFAAGGFASDIRLACHGLDPMDNDFVIGLMGRELTPLSKLVETMRSTVQTSLYLERLGPFFVGQKVWQSEKPVVNL